MRQFNRKHIHACRAITDGCTTLIYCDHECVCKFFFVFFFLHQLQKMEGKLVLHARTASTLLRKIRNNAKSGPSNEFPGIP